MDWVKYLQVTYLIKDLYPKYIMISLTLIIRKQPHLLNNGQKKLNRCFNKDQTDITVRYHGTLIRVSKTVPRLGKDVQQLEISSLLVGMQNGSHVLTHFGDFFKKLKHLSLYDMVIPFLDITIQEKWNHMPKDSYTIFMAALFIIPKIWKTTQISKSKNRNLDRKSYILTVKYNSATKRNELYW